MYTVIQIVSKVQNQQLKNTF